MLAACFVLVCLCLPVRAEAAGSWKASGDQWYYRNEDGSYASGWLEIDGAWYYFDEESGAMASGWQEIAGKWYYFGSSGKMRTGWQEISGKWYYFGGNGKMRTGWQEIGGKWYYFAASGRMATGWQQISGKWYYLAESGRMMTGWQKIGGRWYHFAAGGAMDTGWRKIGSDWYYFKDSGVMADDECVTVSGKRYAFAAGGAWRGEQNATFFAAYDYAQQFIKPGMTKAQKLRACFDGLSGCKEKNPWIPHYKGYDWPQKYADYFFANDAGNCFGFAAAFGYLAKAVGYENVYCCNSGGHGWVEIDGLVYDAEWTRHASGNYFGRSLSETGGPKYKTAITRTDSWQYVKL